MRWEPPEAQRFDALWRRCVASPPSPDSAAVYADLYRLLAAPGRYFHNRGHISDCVRRVDEVAHLLCNPDAVELALWFHDAVYEPGAGTNERLSAEMFMTLSTGGTKAFRWRVSRLILATRHANKVQGHDQRFVVDIDLSGFGAPWEEFMRKGAQVRAEFADLTDAQYHTAQIPFLQRLQRRPQFFSTDYFRQRYEVTAKDNLRRLLALLHAQGYAAPTL